MEATSSAKIEEALKLLEEAAKQKKDELKAAMSDKYTHLKSVLVETEHNLAQKLSEAKTHAVESAAHAKDVVVDKTCEVARGVDKSVHENPWPYIGGTAAVGLLLGYILGRKTS
ncbi:MAG: hypothetical protein NTY53_17470, partial [Kiritimatiellaeota bacterium]|nr:hypothetical protein [Kiritimatiellota bacterium]